MSERDFANWQGKTDARLDDLEGDTDELKERQIKIEEDHDARLTELERWKERGIGACIALSFLAGGSGLTIFLTLMGVI